LDSFLFLRCADLFILLWLYYDAIPRDYKILRFFLKIIFFVGMAQIVKRLCYGRLPGFDSQQDRFMLFVTTSRPAVGPTQSPIRVLSSKIKQLGCEVNRSPPYSAEDKNAWRYTSTLSCVCMPWCLVKHQGNFILMLPVYVGLVINIDSVLKAYTDVKNSFGRSVPSTIP
jgi:hypothetical protein